MTQKKQTPIVGIIMGSISDYETMKYTENTLKEFNVDYEIQVVSAHRTPDIMFNYAKNAKEKGLKIIIAGAGGAAHLPGMVSALTTLPVLAVPVQTKTLNGVDSLLSIVQMPAGIPTATFAIGQAGATNAALFAIQMLALHDEELLNKLINFRKNKEQQAINSTKDLSK
ncbi:MAG: 5-(carboxyamino)imidazole ribonucleotide mutase [Bdellovibrionota bacterium]